MKAKAIILSILFVQVKASFFHDFTGAMSSVEKAFGKLLNDVVTDVKSTVHCTILAMEQLLALRGIVAEPTTYKDECYGYMDQIRDPSNTYNTAYDFKHRTEGDNHKFYSAHDIAKQISSSISRVNESLTNILDGHERLEQVKGLLKHETNRLAEVGLLLKRELEKISHKMKTEFQSITNNSSVTSLESIWNEMKILHDVERNRDTSEAKEISQVLNEALNVLHINNTSDVTSDEEKMKIIMQELSKESSDNNATFTNINRELSQWKVEQAKPQNFSGHKITPEEIPKTFKDIATKMFKDKQNTSKEVTGETLSETANMVTNDKDLKKSDYEHVTKNNEANLAFSGDDSSINDINNEEYRKTIDEANDIIKNSAQAEAMFDNIFGKAGNEASPFDNL